MRHVENGNSLGAQGVENPEQPFGLGPVQGRVRLVEDEQPRTLDQHAAQFHQLLLADAEAGERRTKVDMQPELVEKGAALLLHRGQRDQPVAGRLTVDEEIGQHRAFGKQAQFLIDDTDAVGPGNTGSIDGDRSTVEQDFSAIGTNGTGKHLHQRRLAGAVLAHHGMNGARLHDEVHVGHRDYTAIVLGQVPNLDERGVGHAVSPQTRRAARTWGRPVRSVSDLTRIRPKSAAARR